MDAVVLTNGKLTVEVLPEPVPTSGQVVLETIACGICGSDLHCARHARTFTEAARATGMSMFDFDVDRGLVMGHEFVARIIDLGPGLGESDLPSRLRVGDVVTAHPVVRTPAGFRSVGYSNDHPGGFAQRFVVDASGLVPVPRDLEPHLAALTEPLAVGLHAVNESSAVARGGAIVIGCGPVGLATISALRAQGVGRIVAADLSPARRVLAAALGAAVVVDPRESPAVAAWRAEGGRGPVTCFEAVGVPGMIDRTMRELPSRSELVVVGLCMETDRFEPTIAISKQLTMRFVLGWTPLEFAASLAAIAAEPARVAPFVTAEVDLAATPEAFAMLASPEHHAKVLVRPNGR